jgi:hypothetical protein
LAAHALGTNNAIPTKTISRATPRLLLSDIDSSLVFHRQRRFGHSMRGRPLRLYLKHRQWRISDVTRP